MTIKDFLRYSILAAVLAIAVFALNADAATMRLSGWETQRDIIQGVEFRYPTKLGLQYIHTNATAWPPALQAKPAIRLMCTKPDPNQLLNAEQRKIMIAKVMYCRTISADGAAGSTYETFIYERLISKKQTALTFVLQLSQCGAYDGRAFKQCQVEQKAFNPNTLARQIFATVRFLSPEVKYKSVALKDVLNYFSIYKNNYVRTTGTIFGIKYDDAGGSILLSDNSGSYLLVAICHACIANYHNILSSLKKGDRIEAMGVASFTTPSDSGLTEKFSVAQELPMRIGMIDLDNINKK